MVKTHHHPSRLEALLVEWSCLHVHILCHHQDCVVLVQTWLAKGRVHLHQWIRQQQVLPKPVAVLRSTSCVYRCTVLFDTRFRNVACLFNYYKHTHVLCTLSRVSSTCCLPAVQLDPQIRLT